MIIYYGSYSTNSYTRRLGSLDGNDATEWSRYRTAGATALLEPTKYLDWHHVAAVGKSGRTYFYIDGIMVGSSDRQEISDVYLIGNHDSDEAFAEILDDIRIYSTALTDQEVESIYGKGFGDLGTAPLITGPATVNLSQVNYDVSFSDAGLDRNVSGITQSDVKPIGGTVTDFNGSGNSYSFQVTANQDADEILVSIPPSSAWNLNEDRNYTTEGASFRTLFQPVVHRQEDLISRWTFDEANQSFEPDVGPAKNFALLKGDAHITVGKFGQAMALDGIRDYAEIPAFRGLYGDGDFSIAAWIKLAALGSTLVVFDGGIF